ncbi:MAG: T9SS type A sorting domain-containing protein [Phycisphaerae bacterium]|nr:T9SS type A sorting domain-containing protein [Saprospiraceae bacterium]
MKKIATLLAFTLFTCQGYTQSVIEWQKQIGGSASDLATTILQTSDGGYVAFGTSSSKDEDASGSHGGADVWLVKMDQNGTIEWQRMYGGSSNDYGRSILQTKDGGYIFSGHAHSKDGDISANTDEADCWVVKIDVAGNIEWEKSFGTSPDGIADPSNIIQTEDGGYVVAAFGNFIDYWFFKINDQGVLQWEKFFGGTRSDHLHKMRQTPDKGFILVGGSISNDGDVTGHHGIVLFSDFWVVKTDSLGNMQWQKSLGGSYSDEAFNVLVTSDGSYLVAGLSECNDWDVSGHHGAIHSSDTWVVKLDGQGNILWSRSLGGSVSVDQVYFSMIETTEGDYILAGQSESSDGDLMGLTIGDNDCWMVKLNSTGEILRQKVLGGTNFDAIIDMVRTTDNGFVAVGFSSSTDGDVTVPIHPPAPGQMWYDFWVFKMKNVLTGTDDPSIGSLGVFPNPFSGSFSIMADSESSISQFSMYNLLGQKVLQSYIYDGNPINANSLPEGWYLLNAQMENGKTMQAKLLKADAGN